MLKRHVCQSDWRIRIQPRTLGQTQLAAVHSESAHYGFASFSPSRVFDFLRTTHIWESFLYPPPEEAHDGETSNPLRAYEQKRN